MLILGQGRLSTPTRRSHFSEADAQQIKWAAVATQEPRTIHSDPSLNDLIRARQQQLRNRDSKRLRGLQVDDEVELGGSLDG